MAELTAEQKQAVGQWAGEGATLNDIQTRLKSEFGLSMTYMEARLLVTELEVRLKDKAPKPAPETEAVAAAPLPPEDAGGFDDIEDDALPQPLADESPAPEPGSGAFAMEADELAVPGMLVSGTASFSDGVKAKWFMDQMGRLSLKADQPGYQPPAADVPRFQQGLEKILVKLGLY